MQNYLSNQNLIEDRKEDSDYMFAITSNIEDLLLEFDFPEYEIKKQKINANIKQGRNMHIFK